MKEPRPGRVTLLPSGSRPAAARRRRGAAGVRAGRRGGGAEAGGGVIAPAAVRPLTIAIALFVVVSVLGLWSCVAAVELGPPQPVDPARRPRRAPRPALHERLDARLARTAGAALAERLRSAGTELRRRVSSVVIARRSARSRSSACCSRRCSASSPPRCDLRSSPGSRAAWTSAASSSSPSFPRSPAAVQRRLGGLSIPAAIEFRAEIDAPATRSSDRDRRAHLRRSLADSLDHLQRRLPSR